MEREFDPEGNMTSITVPGSHENTYGYDAMNRATTFTDAAGATATTTYDAEGRVTSRTDRNGKKISYVYNRFSFVESERWHAPDDSIVREFTYDYTRNRLNSVTDGTSTWAISGGLGESLPSRYIFEYEDQARFDLLTSFTDFREVPITSRIRIQDTEDPALDTEYVADLIGDRIVGMKFRMPDNSTGSVQLLFDDDGRPTETSYFDFLSTSDFAAEPVTRSLRTYNAAGDLASIRHENVDGSLIFPEGDLTFSRDPGGRITTRTQPGNTSAYTYDQVDQITAVAHSSFADETFSYDAAGNPTAGTTGADNRLLTLGDLTFTYDAEGNVSTQTDTSTGEVRSFTYDHRNQLTSVTSSTGGVLAEYEYDYKGRMMYRIEEGQKNWILYERDVPHAEFADGATAVNRIYLYNTDKPEETYGMWTAGEGIRWHLTDQIGTVQGIVAPDGSPLHWLDYDTFGTPRTAVPAGFGPLRFAGRYFNAAGLYENSLRHYNPEIRRFQQQDPIRHESQDFNYYRYAENSPLSKTDPLGTNALIEYGTLLSGLAECALAAKAVGDCVSMMLEAAAVGLQGKATEVDIGCAGSSVIGVSSDCAAAGP